MPAGTKLSPSHTHRVANVMDGGISQLRGPSLGATDSFRKRQWKFLMGTARSDVLGSEVSPNFQAQIVELRVRNCPLQQAARMGQGRESTTTSPSAKSPNPPQLTAISRAISRRQRGAGARRGAVLRVGSLPLAPPVPVTAIYYHRFAFPSPACPQALAPIGVSDFAADLQSKPWVFS